MRFTATARSLGIFSVIATVILVVAYAVTLTVGLLSLESPQQRIGDPMSAEKRSSANFPCTEFSEVGSEVRLVASCLLWKGYPAVAEAEVACHI